MGILVTRRDSIALTAGTLAAALLQTAPALGAQSPGGAEDHAIVDVLTALFSALGAEDQARVDALVTPAFYIFDNGKRFDARSMVEMIRSLHASGKRFVWNVTDPDVHVIRDVAWIAYVNSGTISDGQRTVQQQWLESAFLERHAAGWKLAFLQSTRVPPASGERS